MSTRARARAAADDRFVVPLYTNAEASRFLNVPPTTLSTWWRGHERRPEGRKPVKAPPIITGRAAAEHGLPVLPFIGLAEAQVVAAFRREGVSLQHLRNAVRVLKKEIGLEYALASRQLFTDGASVLYDYADRQADEELARLTEIVSRQQVFSEVVQEYLTRITYGDDGWAVRLVSPATERQVVSASPDRGFGRASFIRGGAPVEAVLDRWRGGDPVAEVADDFGVPLEDVEDALRAAYPLAA